LLEFSLFKELSSIIRSNLVEEEKLNSFLPLDSAQRASNGLNKDIILDLMLALSRLISQKQRFLDLLTVVEREREMTGLEKEEREEGVLYRGGRGITIT